MRNLLVYLLVGTALAIAFAPAAGAQSAVPVEATHAGPVFNPDYELGPMAGPAEDRLQGSPIDHCYGVGHQVFYGSETPQGEATGGQLNPYLIGTSEKPNPEEADPQGAVQQIQDDPQGEAEFLIGEGHCVYGDDTGYDIAWVQPVERMQQPAHWSIDIQNPSTEFGYTHDDNPFDREAKLLDKPGRANHNMWQWFGSPHQAWTPNAEALSFDLEAGSIPESASVILSLSTIPQETRHVNGYYLACDLVFDADQLQQALDGDGDVKASPLDANLRARQKQCKPLEKKFEGGNETQKREVLGSTRITQLSFWGWNHGDGPAVVDNVQVIRATTIAEEAAKGNVDASAVGNSATVVACSGHTGDDWNAGVRVSFDDVGLELILPKPEDVQAEATSLASHILEHQTFGNSVSHVSVHTDGAPTAGAGTDDIPGLTSGNGGGDGNWYCPATEGGGTAHDEDTGEKPAKPFDNLAGAAGQLP